MQYNAKLSYFKSFLLHFAPSAILLALYSSFFCSFHCDSTPLFFFLQCRPYSLGLVMPGQWWYTVLDTSFGWTINIYLNSNDSTLLNTTDEITMLNENETLLCQYVYGKTCI